MRLIHRVEVCWCFVHHYCRQHVLSLCSVDTLGDGGLETQLLPAWIIIPSACYTSGLNNTASWHGTESKHLASQCKHCVLGVSWFVSDRRLTALGQQTEFQHLHVLLSLIILQHFIQATQDLVKFRKVGLFPVIFTRTLWTWMQFIVCEVLASVMRQWTQIPDS